VGVDHREFRSRLRRTHLLRARDVDRPPPSVWVFLSVTARSPSWVRMNLDDVRGLLESLFEARNVSSSP
jgi:hypothetical protein